MLVDNRASSKSDLTPLALPLLAVLALWTIVPAFLHSAPPLDVVESAVWGREWVVGTYKHPAMPAWVLEISRTFNGGRIGWAAYFLGALFPLATLVLTYLLGRDLLGARAGVAAAIALFGVEYFSWRIPEFNHTQAQIPFWMGAAWAAWRAVQSGGLVWWLALGAMAAAGLYGKLSNAMLLIVVAGWIVSTPRGRGALKTAGPYAGALLFCALAAPLAHWLIQSHFAPLTYAEGRARDQSLTASLLFPLNAALQALPIVATLGLAGFFVRDGKRLSSTDDARRFLWIVAAAPLAISLLLAIISRSGLRASWIAPALPLLTLLLIAQVRGRLDDDVLQRLKTLSIALACLIPIGYGAAVASKTVFGGSQLRQSWPQVAIARSMSSAWREATGKPLKIVMGRAWPAGLVALDHPDKPSIFTEGEYAFSPWITPERLAREGALVVWSEMSNAGLTPAMQTLIAGRAIQERRIANPHGKGGADIVLKYVTVAPQ